MRITIEVPGHLPFPEELLIESPDIEGTILQEFTAIQGMPNAHRQMVSIEQSGKALLYVPNKNSGVWGNNNIDVITATLKDYYEDRERPVTILIKRTEPNAPQGADGNNIRALAYTLHARQVETVVPQPPFLHSSLTSDVNQETIDGVLGHAIDLDYEVTDQLVRETRTVTLPLTDDNADLIANTTVVLDYTDESYQLFAPIRIGLEGKQPGLIVIDLNAHLNQLPFALIGIENLRPESGLVVDYKIGDFNSDFGNDFYLKKGFVDSLLSSYPGLSGKEDIFFDTHWLPNNINADFNNDFSAGFFKSVRPSVVVFQPFYEHPAWQQVGHEEVLGYTVLYQGVEYTSIIIITA